MKPSEQVKRIIKACPLTAYRLAKLAGIRNSVLSLFLSGERTITLETLDALARVLGFQVTADMSKADKLAADAPKPGRPAAKATRRKDR